MSRAPSGGRLGRDEAMHASYDLQSTTPLTTHSIRLDMAEQKAPNLPARIYSDILNRIIEGEYKEM